MNKELVSKFSGTLFCFATVALLWLAGYFEHYVLLEYDHPLEVPSLEATVMLGLACLLSTLPRKMQPWACSFFVLLNQVWMFVDVTYYRFFNDLPSMHLLPTWFQAGRVGSSLHEVLRVSDLLMLWPAGAFAGLLFMRSRLQGESKEDPVLPRVALILIAVLLGHQVWTSVHPVRYQQLQRRFQNKAIWHLFGTQFYHFYDLFEWTRVSLGWEGGRRLEKELVEQVIGQSRRTSSVNTPMKGRYAGRDFIFIQLESLEAFAIDADFEGRAIAPFLHQAAQRVLRFELFDQTHLGRSADGQFIFLNSLHPPASRPLPFVYPTNDYYGLPEMFAEKGYETLYFEPVEDSFWNAGIIARSYGFRKLFFRDELPPDDPKQDVRGWGLTDAALYRKVQEKTAGLKEPFFCYVVTVMCHHPYSESSNQPVDFPPKDKLNMVRRYLRCVASRDENLRNFLLQLSTTERGRRTVICVAGDHDANLNQAEMKNLGFPVFPEREKVPLLLGTVNEFLGLESDLTGFTPPNPVGGQIDVAPTLGHVFSLNMEESVFVGWNLLATENRGTYHCRLGTWMDPTGKIRESEEARASEGHVRFEVSEMLLQSDKIKDFRHPF